MINREDYEFICEISKFMAEAIKNKDFIPVEVTEIKTSIKGGYCTSKFTKSFDAHDIKNCLNYVQKKRFQMTREDLLLTIKNEIYKYEDINNLTPNTLVISKDYINEIGGYYESLIENVPLLRCHLFGLEVIPTTVKNFIMVGDKVEKLINEGE